MKLRSIPPANRVGSSRLARLSSMRAADRAGMVFVGRHGPRQAQPSAPGEGGARVVRPDAQAQRERQAFQQAWGARIKQLGALLADAATLEEAAFWRRELEQSGGYRKGEN